VSNKIYGYVLVSDGAHPGDDIFRCQRALPQIRPMQEFADRRGAKLALCYDYKRRVTKLGDLPTLTRTLTRFKDNGDVILVIECLARLVQKPEPMHRAAFIQELKEYGDHLLGLRQKRKFSSYSMQGLVELATVVPPRRPRVPGAAKRQRDTEPMSRASATRRTSRSHADGRMLAQIRQELMDLGQPATLRAIAAEANARGYRNQRGKEWSEAAVSVRLAEFDAAMASSAAQDT
jgi:hypothetical protein